VQADYETISARRLQDSSLTQYVGIEERRGLSGIGKGLLKGILFLRGTECVPTLVSDVKAGKLEVLWRKALPETLKRPAIDGKTMVAISAFHLTGLEQAQRRQVIKEMWDSGADVMVIMICLLVRQDAYTAQIVIDHSTPTGFAHIIEAREYLLGLGKRAERDHEEAADAHVVAPVGLQPSPLVLWC
jgi:hypothetical protein